MKKVLIYGLGITGISTIKTLASLGGYDLYSYDAKKKEAEALKDFSYQALTLEEARKTPFDFVVKSPGIAPRDDLVSFLSEKTEVISDIELSYRLFPDVEKIAVTGSNGKTTTTSLIAHILNESGRKAIAVGNIGEGILWQIYNNREAIFVEEISSFQAYSLKDYRPHLALLLNISPDHLDRHGSYENYYRSKFKVVENQGPDDILILNHDDEILKENREGFKGKILEFSSKEVLDEGIYLKGNELIYGGREILNTEDLNLVGSHNYENVMAAILACLSYGLDLSEIIPACLSFKPFGHRMEYVGEFNQVKFYDDSKGTNVDASIKALSSFDEPIILLAGGFDKKVDFHPLFDAFKENGKHMILMGQTKEELADLCREYGYPFTTVSNMEEAIKEAFKLMEAGDVVLLSPASASWGMYDNFAQRGEDFKEKVKKEAGN